MPRPRFAKGLYGVFTNVKYHGILSVITEHRPNLILRGEIQLQEAQMLLVFITAPSTEQWK